VTAAWEPGRLSLGGQAIHAKLTGRRDGVVPMMPAPPPAAQVIHDLTDIEQSPPGLPEQVQHLAEQLQQHLADHAAAEQETLPWPLNELTGDDWDGT
jgi:hypothetical protein